MELSFVEKQHVSELKDKLRQEFSWEGKDFPSVHDKKGYLDLCYALALLEYPDVLPVLGYILHTECDIAMEIGYPENFSPGNGDAIVYWLARKRSHKSYEINPILRKFSNDRVVILYWWIRIVAMPLYARLCFNDIKIAEKLLNEECRLRNEKINT